MDQWVTPWTFSMLSTLLLWCPYASTSGAPRADGPDLPPSPPPDTGRGERPATASHPPRSALGAVLAGPGRPAAGALRYRAPGAAGVRRARAGQAHPGRGEPPPLPPGAPRRARGLPSAPTVMSQESNLGVFGLKLGSWRAQSTRVLWRRPRS